MPDEEDIETTTAHEYISTAYNALCAVDGYEGGSYQEIKEIREMSIEIIHNQLKKIHAEVFPRKKK